MNSIKPTLKSLWGKVYLKHIKVGYTFWVPLDRDQVPVSEDRWNDYRIKFPKRSKSLVTWFRIRITYIRSGVFFYVIDNFVNVPEQYFLEDSLFAEALIPCIINLKELEEYWGMPFDNIDNYNDPIDIEFIRE